MLILRNVMFLNIKKNYHETILDDAVDTKGTIQDSAIGMKSRIVGHRFLTQAKNCANDWSFVAMSSRANFFTTVAF